MTHSIREMWIEVLWGGTSLRDSQDFKDQNTLNTQLKGHHPAFFLSPFLPHFLCTLTQRMMWGKQWNSLNFPTLRLLSRFFLGKRNLPQYPETKRRKNKVKYIGFFSNKAQRGFWQETIVWKESENIVERMSEGPPEMKPRQFFDLCPETLPLQELRPGEF